VARRERIARLARIGFCAARLTQDLASVEPVTMPLAMAERVQELLQAARDVAAMVETELLALESARDWTPGEPA
jgi:hypothetical protein